MRRLDNDCNGIVPVDETDDDLDGQAECEGDCDDADAANFDGNAEACDGQDDDCDGATSAGDGETDDDGDGVLNCADCADLDANNFPGNVEICDALDNDCDTVVPVDETDDDLDGQAECEGDCDDADVSTLMATPKRATGRTTTALALPTSTLTAKWTAMATVRFPA